MVRTASKKIIFILIDVPTEVKYHQILETIKDVLFVDGARKSIVGLDLRHTMEVSRGEGQKAGEVTLILAFDNFDSIRFDRQMDDLAKITKALTGAKVKLDDREVPLCNDIRSGKVAE